MKNINKLSLNEENALGILTLGSELERFSRLGTIKLKTQFLSHALIKKEIEIIRDDLFEEKAKKEFLKELQAAFDVIKDSYIFTKHQNRYKTSTMGLDQLFARRSYNTSNLDNMTQSMYGQEQKSSGIEPGITTKLYADTYDLILKMYPKQEARCIFIKENKADIAAISDNFTQLLPRYMLKNTYKDKSGASVFPDKEGLERTNALKFFGFLSQYIATIACNFPTKDITELNFNAALEVLSTDIARKMGIVTEQKALYPMEFKDGTLLLGALGTWVKDSHKLGGKDGKGECLKGEKNNNYLVKELILPEKNGIKYISDNSIKKISEQLAMILAMGNKDAVGSVGANELRVGNDIVVIDLGHAYKENVINNILNNFHIKNDKFKNIAVFYDSSRSEIVKGLLRIAAMRVGKLDEKILKSYGEEFFESVRQIELYADEKVFDDYIADLDVLKDYHSSNKKNEEICSKVIEKLKDAKELAINANQDFVTKFKNYLTVPKDVVDLVENIEKVISGKENTSLLSPDGTVLLNHISIKKPFNAWKISFDSDSKKHHFELEFGAPHECQAAIDKLEAWMKKDLDVLMTIKKGENNKIIIKSHENKLEKVFNWFSEDRIKKAFHESHYDLYQQFQAEINVVSLLHLVFDPKDFRFEKHPDNDGSYQLTAPAFENGYLKLDITLDGGKEKKFNTFKVSTKGIFALQKDLQEHLQKQLKTKERPLNVLKTPEKELLNESKIEQNFLSIPVDFYNIPINISVHDYIGKSQDDELISNPQEMISEEYKEIPIELRPTVPLYVKIQPSAPPYEENQPSAPYWSLETLPNNLNDNSVPPDETKTESKNQQQESSVSLEKMIPKNELGETVSDEIVLQQLEAKLQEEGIDNIYPTFETEATSDLQTITVEQVQNATSPVIEQTGVQVPEQEVVSEVVPENKDADEGITKGQDLETQETLPNNLNDNSVPPDETKTESKNQQQESSVSLEKMIPKNELGETVSDEIVIQPLEAKPQEEVIENIYPTFEPETTSGQHTITVEPVQNATPPVIEQTGVSEQEVVSEVVPENKHADEGITKGQDLETLETLPNNLNDNSVPPDETKTESKNQQQESSVSLEKMIPKNELGKTVSDEIVSQQREAKPQEEVIENIYPTFEPETTSGQHAITVEPVQNATPPVIEQTGVQVPEQEVVSEVVPENKHADEGITKGQDLETPETLQDPIEQEISTKIEQLTEKLKKLTDELKEKNLEKMEIKTEEDMMLPIVYFTGREGIDFSVYCGDRQRAKNFFEKFDYDIVSFAEKFVDHDKEFGSEYYSKMTDDQKKRIDSQLKPLMAAVIENELERLILSLKNVGNKGKENLQIEKLVMKDSVPKDSVEQEITTKIGQPTEELKKLEVVKIDKEEKSPEPVLNSHSVGGPRFFSPKYQPQIEKVEIKAPAPKTSIEQEISTKIEQLTEKLKKLTDELKEKGIGKMKEKTKEEMGRFCIWFRTVEKSDKDGEDTSWHHGVPVKYHFEQLDYDIVDCAKKLIDKAFDREIYSKMTDGEKKSIDSQLKPFMALLLEEELELQKQLLQSEKSKENVLSTLKRSTRL
jgi:hypothetical protein